MFICLDKNIGSIVASDIQLDTTHYVLCDGRTIRRTDYPELFKALGIYGDTLRNPNMRGLLPGVSFYYIAKEPADHGCK